ncbi:unnamed protein product [Allacma fusca]|uniref:Uncharacterized protein n=1 Tax=Allacma fusca TaxID=39272 RepID=A0A8J2LJA4_9HEXA|nr:unnamed protein product [Allacma fusca]
MKLTITETPKYLPGLQAANDHVVVETHNRGPDNKFYRDFKFCIYLGIFVLTATLFGLAAYSWLQMTETVPATITSEAPQRTSGTFFTVPQSTTTALSKPPVSATTTIVTQRTTSGFRTTTSDEKTSSMLTLPHSSTTTQPRSSSSDVTPPDEEATTQSTGAWMTTEISSTFTIITASTSSVSSTNTAISTETETTNELVQTTPHVQITTIVAQTSVQLTTTEEQTTAESQPVPKPMDILLALVNTTSLYVVRSGWEGCKTNILPGNSYNLTSVLLYKKNSTTAFSASVLSSSKNPETSHQGPAFLILNHTFPDELSMYQDPITGWWPKLWEDSHWTNSTNVFTCK